MGTDKIIEQAIIRKGTQDALGALSRVESTHELRRIMSTAERKYRQVWLRRQVWAFASAAAVVAAVLVIGFQPSYSTEELYARWSGEVVYEPIVIRGEDAAQEAFESALAIVQAGRYDEAIAKFVAITADPTSEYIQDARWQLMLLYLKTDQRSRAKETLRIIVESDDIYADQAQKLIHEITEKQWF